MRRSLLLAFAVVVACTAASSHSRADVVDDCIAQNERAIELRKGLKLLDARKASAACAVSACGEEIQRACTQRVDEIIAALPSVVLEVKDAMGTDVADAVISLDGATLERAAVVAAITLDPGEHVVSVSAPGMRTTEQRLLVREGEKLRRERLVLVAAAAEPKPSPTTPAPPSEALARRATWATISGWAGVGVGAAALSVGAVFGIVAKSKSDQSNQEGRCTGNACDPDGKALRLDALDAARTSTVAVVAGGALTAVGISVLLFGPKETRAAVLAGPGSIAVRAGF
ncbi:MAG: hypothetical protein JNL38_21575 [Myxococcales bacterium]|jgi:hypothetical protein|nr:hypothetical protein [Myxococcales bacterium]